MTKNPIGRNKDQRSHTLQLRPSAAKKKKNIFAMGLGWDGTCNYASISKLSFVIYLMIQVRHCAKWGVIRWWIKQLCPNFLEAIGSCVYVRFYHILIFSPHSPFTYRTLKGLNGFSQGSDFSPKHTLASPRIVFSLELWLTHWTNPKMIIFLYSFFHILGIVLEKHSLWN